DEACVHHRHHDRAAARLRGGGHALAAQPLYVLSRPAAPAEAAENDGVTIDLDRIVAAFREIAARPGVDFVLVEGAGGLLVPLTPTALMADLAARLGLPLLLVARARLGTINHTLLTVREIERRGLPFAGTVLNLHEADTLDHARWIDAFGGRVLGRYPDDLAVILRALLPAASSSRTSSGGA
ncbi:MAG: dethiobiotin synthase, partial [Myxococcota bacterium]